MKLGMKSFVIVLIGALGTPLLARAALRAETPGTAQQEFESVLPSTVSPPNCSPTHTVELWTPMGAPVKANCVVADGPTCPGNPPGINRQTETCDMVQTYRVQYWEYGVTATGQTCVIDQSSEIVEEVVGQSFKELGDVCPPAPSVCCVATDSKDFEINGDAITSFASSTTTFECRNGQMGTKTVTIAKEGYEVLRKFVTVIEPVGNCDPGEECDDDEYTVPTGKKNWTKITITTTINCP